MKTRLACFVVIAVCLVALSASATSLVRLSLDQLTQASNAVLKGHVVGQTTQWNATHTEIVTLTTIAVDQNVKGNTPAQVVVEQMGGTIGHMHLMVPGTERFYPQAHYELFLQAGAANPSHFLLVGMREGAYRIYRDPETHQERVINPVGNVFYRNGSGALPSASPTGSSTAVPATMPLDEFQQKVSSAMARPIVIPRGTAIPMIVRSVSFDGVGRVQLEAETSAELYPNSRVVVPAGSRVDGWGQESGGRWTLHWTAVSIRGSQAHISATDHVASASRLRGEHLTVMTR
ncbi:MAG: hypothetical protein ACRD18_10210 [Terriglobia bacterium]